jgi:hypothetical protein
MRMLIPMMVAFCFVAQDAKKECDLAKIEDGKYCGKCKKILVKTDKVTDFDKEGNCKECKSTPEPVKVCVKEWIPRCGMHDMQPHEKCCCTSKFCCKVEIVYSLITFKCSGCEATASTEEAIKHAEKEHEKKVTKSCAKSATFPHGGELPKPK